VRIGEQASDRQVPPWLYKLFTGQQYPYVRRQAKFERKDRQPNETLREPTREEIDEKFWEIFPKCSVKILQEVKTGMIVSFVELGNYEPGTYQELVEHPEEFLAREYGKKKIKVNFYNGDNFVCTINFKVDGWTGHEEE
jgi:glycine/serine hydroxymethyltransferase